MLAGDVLRVRDAEEMAAFRPSIRGRWRVFSFAADACVARRVVPQARGLV